MVILLIPVFEFANVPFLLPEGLKPPFTRFILHFNFGWGCFIQFLAGNLVSPHGFNSKFTLVAILALADVLLAFFVLKELG
ncbi:MAG: hypothetical protein N3E48_00340 [Candidatus Bathyarchaeota archaeon]|nr:hypothetical protein [Candidatus Bathyarchaeota archaeon]